MKFRLLKSTSQLAIIHSRTTTDLCHPG